MNKTRKVKEIMHILAIESSCDETAAAVIEVSRQGNQLSVISTDNLITDNSVLSTNILSNVIASQIDIHKKYGGVFPEQASRAHAEKIIPVIEEALGKIEPDVIAVTTGPGLIGSLLIGVNAAKTFAYVKNKPIIGINHWLGHIYSNFVRESQNSNVKTQKKVKGMSPSAMPVSRTPSGTQSETRLDRVAGDEGTPRDLPLFPSLILIVSGGHTGLVLMKSHTKIITLGETLDDAAGEAFDKVAKLLGLGYPGGPAISKAALKGNPKAYNFPRAMTDRKDYNFSFSGLKTAVLNESRKHNLENQVMRDIAASFQQTVIDILINKTDRAAYEYKPKSICLCGGVSANKELRSQMQKMVEKLPWKCSYHIPDIILSTDNAAMIGLAAAYQDESKWTTFDKINADSNLKL